MTDQEKVITYLRSIARDQSLARAQKTARCALRILGVDLSKESGQ
jgi:hypothetical protein